MLRCVERLVRASAGITVSFGCKKYLSVLYNVDRDYNLA